MAKQAKTPRKPKKVSGIGKCSVCGLTYFYHSVRIPTTCGVLYCRAMDEWGPDEWEGQARMAQARREANRQIVVLSSGYEYHNIRDEDVFAFVAKIVPAELTPLDHEALARCPH